MRLTSPASCRSPGASSGIGMSILIGLKRARGLHRSLYRDSDHAHLHLGTHGLTQPKCQKFEGIPMRCGEKSPTAIGVLILPGATALVFAKGFERRPPISYDSVDRGVALGPGPTLRPQSALCLIP
jgi:hypothetical protein